MRIEWIMIVGATLNPADDERLNTADICPGSRLVIHEFTFQKKINNGDGDRVYRHPIDPFLVFCLDL
jgi:hypothetical protein